MIGTRACGSCPRFLLRKTSARSGSGSAGSQTAANPAPGHRARLPAPAPRKTRRTGTHQGSVDNAHLPSYLNEFAFRLNRRHSRSGGMVFYRVLELAVRHDPVRYGDIVAGQRPHVVPPTPPPQTRGRPASLARAPAERPWRSG